MLRGGFRLQWPVGGHMFADHLLAGVIAVLPRMRELMMQCAVAYDHGLLSAGPMARSHLVSTGCLRLGRLNTFLLRRSGRRRGGVLSEGYRAQTESGDSGERQHKPIHDVL